MEETQEKIAQIINIQKGQSEHTPELNGESITLEELKKCYLSSASAIGILLLYICRLSTDSQKEFYFCKILKGYEEYSLGFLISTISIGLVEAEIDDKNKDIYNKNQVINDDNTNLDFDHKNVVKTGYEDKNNPNNTKN